MYLKRHEYLSGGNDLTSTALALGGTLNDTRQIENLNLSAAILQHTGNRCQGGESIGSNLALRLGDLGQEG